MTTASEWKALARRAREATGPDKQLDLEISKEISDGLFDALVYLIDDAWSRGNKQGRAEGMEAAAKVAEDDSCERSK